MLDHLTKEPSKADMVKKVEAWKTINSVLVKANSEFMDKLGAMLTEKTVQHEQLKEKLEKSEEEELHYARAQRRKNSESNTVNNRNLVACL